MEEGRKEINRKVVKRKKEKESKASQPASQRGYINIKQSRFHNKEYFQGQRGSFYNTGEFNLLRSYNNPKC